jgi:hypothetical protein
MYLPDPIERGEASCERWAEEHMKGNMFKCGCGKWVDINKAETLSPDPYAIPVCPDCFEEWWESNSK